MARTLRLLLIAALVMLPSLALAPDQPPEEFIPTEEIPADTAIALPVDI